MSEPLSLILAQCEHRLAQFTRPTFERDVVEALLGEIHRLNAKPDWSVDDPLDTDALHELEEQVDDLHDETVDLQGKLNAQSIRANRLEMELAQLSQQALTLSTQIQWFIDASPEALTARLNYLRDMRARLEATSMPPSAGQQRQDLGGGSVPSVPLDRPRPHLVRPGEDRSRGLSPFSGLEPFADHLHRLDDKQRHDNNAEAS
jgi:hypothetical protein